MWFVSIPMILLYTIGILAIKINSRKASKLTRNNQY
jgi:Sec-independent protein secretion pathway component TatC